MRGSKPICLLCRLQAAQAAGKTPTIQWQTQTARISTASQRHDATGADRAALGNGVASESTSSLSQSPQHLRRFLAHDRSLDRGLKSNVQNAQTKTNRTREQSSSRVDALFQQIVQEQQSLDSTLGHTPAKTNASLVKAIGVLQDMIEGGTPVAEAYSYFQTEIDPISQTPGTHVPQAYHKVKFELLEKLIEAKQADMLGETLPDVAHIFRLYAEAGELKPKQWAALVGELVRTIIKMDPSAETESIAKYERQLTIRRAMLADLVESWKVLSLPRLAMLQTGEDELTDGYWFPRLDKFFLNKYAQKRDFNAAFSTLFPQYPGTQITPHIVVLAIVTYALMHDSTRCPINVRRDATPFTSKVADLVTFINYQDDTLRKDLATTFPDLEEYVMGIWPGLRAYLNKKRPLNARESIRTRRISLPTNGNRSTQVFDAGLIGHRLGLLQGPGNLRELDRLWGEFVGPEETISEERAAQIRQNPNLIDSFLKARISLNQPEKAIAAWNVIGQVGLKPSLRTWNLMLDGLRSAGNINGIKNIWAKLTKSGITLDTGIWTTRIAGLIDCGDIQGGLHALDEMAKLWEKVPRGNAVQPTIEPINAALAGLLRRRYHDAAEKLLEWAGRKGIQPDVVTFNTMLRSLIRDKGRSKDVERLFATMQAQGVRADEATFVIVLDSSFSEHDIRDPEDQANIVDEVASTMTAAGLELNMKTYGKMIYLLLRSNARTAAMAVVNHLYNRNLELSPHIYTMLVENCFAQSPPDLDSVHLFVQRRRRLDFDDMDHVFYERVTRGYALAGETQAALDTYRHISKAGSTVPLGVLEDLLRALVRADRLDDARDIVNCEKNRFESQHPDPTGHAGYWGHQFWGLAHRYGLLDTPLPSPRAA